MDKIKNFKDSRAQGTVECDTIQGEGECRTYSAACEWRPSHCEGLIRNGCEQAYSDRNYLDYVSYEGCYADAYCYGNYNSDLQTSYHCIDFENQNEVLCNSTPDCYWNTIDICESNSGKNIFCRAAKSESSCNFLSGCTYTDVDLETTFIWPNQLPKINSGIGNYYN